MSHWDDDLLNRKEDAQHIYDVAMKIHDDGVVTGRTGVVMAIDAPWGEGKSYLIERLRKDIKEKKHPVIHFNAWENDFSNDPIVSFLSELSEGLRNEFPTHKVIVDKVTEASMLVAKKVAATIMAGLLKKAIGISANELIHALKDKPQKDTEPFSTEINKDIFSTHIEKKDAIQKFKTRIEELVETIQKRDNSKQLPIFVIIDELDRCRPNFSVELLEGVKHLFSINGVVFLIAINQKEIQNSIKVLYGNGFNSTMYLKRFFDVEYKLNSVSMLGVWQSEFRNYFVNENSFYMPCEGSFDEFILGITTTFNLTPRDIRLLAFKLYLVCGKLKEIGDQKIHIIYLLMLMVLDYKGLDFKITENTLLETLNLKHINCNPRNYGDGNKLILHKYSIGDAYELYHNGFINRGGDLMNNIPFSARGVLILEVMASKPEKNSIKLNNYQEAIKNIGRILI